MPLFQSKFRSPTDFKQYYKENMLSVCEKNDSLHKDNINKDNIFTPKTYFFFFFGNG